MTEIAPEAARRIIERVGGSGQPPEYGSHLFTVGLEPYLTVIEKEYLSGFVRQGGSAFKMVVGVYGGGKTHFLYCVRDLAWKHNFVVSYVDLRQGEKPVPQAGAGVQGNRPGPHAANHGRGFSFRKR